MSARTFRFSVAAFWIAAEFFCIFGLIEIFSEAFLALSAQGGFFRIGEFRATLILAGLLAFVFLFGCGIYLGYRALFHLSPKTIRLTVTVATSVPLVMAIDWDRHFHGSPKWVLLYFIFGAFALLYALGRFVERQAMKRLFPSEPRIRH